VKRVIAIAFMLCLVAFACSGSDEHRVAGPSTPSTSPSPPTTTVPEITEVPRPANVKDETWRWFVHPGPSGAQILFGVKRNSEPGPHPPVLLVNASGGLNVDYVTFGDKLSDRGFDVALGCWFAASDIMDPQNLVIPCTDAPPFIGVADAAVPALDSLIDGARRALGASTPMVPIGFSRGGGIVALRASEGSPEPVVLVSGMYEGWNGIDSTVPGGEVNVVERVSSRWRAPTLILHGTADAAVPVVQAYDLEAALRAIGVDVEAHYYEGAGHNLAGEPGVEQDMLDRITNFLCARLACSGA